MEFPTWFREAIQRRLDGVSARIERHPEWQSLRAEEAAAFGAMFPGAEHVQRAAYMEWEDRHHLRQAFGE